MKTVLLFSILCLIVFSGCSDKPDDKNLENVIETDFVWDLKNPQLSPEIHLSNIPKETKRINFYFFDASNEWEHGGGSVLYEGAGIIPAGALKEFKGISSLWGIPKIRLVVEAFNQKNELLGTGVITKTPPE